MVTTTSEGAAIGPHEHPRMHWGAVFAGWFIATGMAALLYLFGLAVGFSAFDPYHAAAEAKGLSAGAIVWLILTWAAALWIGSMFASWFEGSNDTEMGVVRGIAVWGVSMTATGLLVASGATHFLLFATSTTLSPVDATAAATAHNTAVAMWTGFVSAVLALVTSAFGGWTGAHHVHRIYHLRTYGRHARL